MAINYAQKYSSQVDERFRTGSLTDAAVNNAYDWTGVNTVQVYSIPTVAMTNYSMTGTARYGNPSELENSVQTMTLAKDRAFSFSIDRRSFQSTVMAQEAGLALSRQIDEVVIPEIEVYRIAKMVEDAGYKQTPTAITSSNAYDLFLDGINMLTDNKVPPAGRVALVTPKFYKSIKLDGSFMRQCDVAQEMLRNGQVGLVDGVPLILAPSSYFPKDVAFILTHPSATVAPVKLCDYKIHDNPPGINGWLVEGRVVYDAFVLNSKSDAIYVQYDAKAA